MTLNQETSINRLKLIIDDLNNYRFKNKNLFFKEQINSRLKQSLKSYYEDLSLISKDLLTHSEINSVRVMKNLNKENK